MNKYIITILERIYPTNRPKLKEENFDAICDSISFTSNDLEEKHILKTIEMAEKSLEETNKSFDSNTNKSSIIMGFIVSITIGLISYFFSKNHFSFNYDFSPFLFSLFTICILLFVLSIYLSSNFMTGLWYKSGVLPSSFLHKDFLHKKNESEDYNFYNGILINTFRNYEKRINCNENKNSIASYRINLCLYFFIRTPIYFTCIYVSVLLINYLLSLY